MPRALPAFASLALLAAGASGCTPYRLYEKCGLHGCPGDAEISVAVRALLDRHTELKAPNAVYVQTLDRVVFLSGQVVTDAQRETAESLARQVPGVRGVADEIALEYNGR
jgi:osmotically-inducible protein OsmY